MHSVIKFVLFKQAQYMVCTSAMISLQWRHNGHDGVSNHQPQDCLLNRLFRRRSKKTSKLRVTGLCVGNSPGIGEFPAQMASNAENVSIWWCHHVHGNPSDFLPSKIFVISSICSPVKCWISNATSVDICPLSQLCLGVDNASWTNMAWIDVEFVSHILHWRTWCV